jgi:predicted dehydrogenase
MSRQLKVGLAGCGSVAQRGLIPHLAQPDLKDRIEFYAVMDPVEGRAKATAEQYKLPRWYEDYDAFLEKGDLDVVVIASPIGFHYEQGMKAIAAGKNVHFNKTMTTTKAEADAVIAAAEAKGVKLVASPGQMQRGIYREAKRLLEQGVIGMIYHVITGRSWIGHEYEGFRTGESVTANVNPLWYYRKQLGGGPMYDMVVYAMHALTGMLGPARRVVAMSGIGLPERQFKDNKVVVDMDDNTHLLLAFDKGVFAHVYGTFASGPRRPEFQFSGSAGSMDIGREGIKVYGDPSLFGVNQATLEAPSNAFGSLPFVTGAHANLPEPHVYSDIMHQVDCVLNDKKPVVSAEHARHVIEIFEAGYRSAQTGQMQELTTAF